MSETARGVGVNSSSPDNMVSDMTCATPMPRVLIVLAYYNGENYIREQLDSLFAQTHYNLCIHLVDDASDTPFDADALGLAPHDRARLTVHRRNQRLGFVLNFLSGLCEADESSDFYFFCDQDDIWAPDKVEVALQSIRFHSGPALYCSRTKIVDATGRRQLGLSPLFVKPPAFTNALVQNLGGGNTMALNRAARELLFVAEEHRGEFVPASHDWWCYQLVSGAGGLVYYDPQPRLRYRQHNHNLVGANLGMRARAARFKAMLVGHFMSWNDRNLAALEAVQHLLNEDARRVLRDLCAARRSRGFLRRLHFVRRSAVHRQTAFGNIGLLFAVILGRI